MISIKNYFLKYKSNIIIICLVLYDMIFANLSYFLSLLFRFEFRIGSIPVEFFTTWVYTVPFFSVAALLINVFLKLYKSVWRYVSYSEVIRTFVACFSLAVIQVIITLLLGMRMPLSYYLCGWMIMFIFLCGIRVSYRAVRILLRSREEALRSLEKVLIVGAGAAGRITLRELRSADSLTSKVVGFIDDSRYKQGKYIDGVKVLGTSDDIPEIVRKNSISKIVLAIPSANKKCLKEIISICVPCDCKLQIIPSFMSRSNVDDNNVMLDNIKIEDLLGRDVIDINDEQKIEFLSDKKILITGGGGSIGSELVRQTAEYNPEHIIIFDVYENNVFDIQQEMLHRFPKVKLTTVIGSVRDEKRVYEVFKKCKPDIIFHAAAHKHVPFMEENPAESIKNNVKGTYNCAMAAIESGADKFILVSTDKAVNPTNIMGASKRLCEMIIEHLSEEKNRTEFCAVRFGNVLGSNGSVVPFFKNQIAAGGPVTVTHPEITRYFMTIPEAVSLMLQAGIYAKGGEIFVLDMGKPVKIDDLARNMIILAGYIPDVDIEIKYVGLRPGEKLYEELLMQEEGLKKTDNKLIYIGKPSGIGNDFMEKIRKLMSEAEENSDDIIPMVEKMVSTYYPKRDNVDN